MRPAPGAHAAYTHVSPNAIKIAADLIATEYGFTRDDVDALAVESQRRAADAAGVRGSAARGGGSNGCEESRS